MIVNQYNIMYKIKWLLKKNSFLFSPIVSFNARKLIASKPMFQFVEIETFNRCNGNCSFCPANKNVDKRKPQYMKEELFYKIIGELENMNYNGNLALFSNNEPFLDSRIIEFTKIAREKLPQAHIYLYCNGTLLTLKKFHEIINYLDELVIDNYSDALELHENVKEIEKICKFDKRLNNKVEIYIRKENEVLSSRGNQAPNKKNNKTQKIKCLLPFVQLIIRPDGKVSLCCNDVYGKYTLGDCSSERLQDIWYSDRYKKIREIMLQKGRRGIDLCRYCDNTSVAAVSIKYGKKRFLFSKK